MPAVGGASRELREALGRRGEEASVVRRPRSGRGARRSASRASRRRTASASRYAEAVAASPPPSRAPLAEPARDRVVEAVHRARRRGSRTGSSPASVELGVDVEGPVRRIRRERRADRGRPRRRARAAPARSTAIARSAVSASGGGTRSIDQPARVLEEHARRLAVGVAADDAARGIGRGRGRSPAAASAARLAHERVMVERAEGDEPARRGALEVVRGRPARPSVAGPSRRRGSSPGAATRAAAAAAMRSSPRSSVIAERQVDLLGGERGAGDVEVRVGQPRDGDLARLELDPAGCAGPPASRARPPMPANATLPSRIPIASTQPKPASPAKVAMRRR